MKDGIHFTLDVCNVNMNNMEADHGGPFNNPSHVTGTFRLRPVFRNLYLEGLIVL